MDLVLNLHRAAMENQKMELRGQVLGFSVAVMNAMDSFFNSGKGKVLDNWLQAMNAGGNEGKGKAPRRHGTLSSGARAFFLGLPKKED